MQTPWADAVKLTPVTGQKGRYVATVDECWTVGATAQGGYAVALLVRAMQLELSPLGFPDPLTVSAYLLSQTNTGAAELVVDVLKGAGQYATATARCVQGGKTRSVCTALFVDMGKRSGHSHVHCGARAPPLPPPAQCIPFPGGLGARFSQQRVAAFEPNDMNAAFVASFIDNARREYEAKAKQMAAAAAAKAAAAAAAAASTASAAGDAKETKSGAPAAVAVTAKARPSAALELAPGVSLPASLPRHADEARAFLRGVPRQAIADHVARGWIRFLRDDPASVPDATAVCFFLDALLVQNVLLADAADGSKSRPWFPTLSINLQFFRRVAPAVDIDDKLREEAAAACGTSSGCGCGAECKCVSGARSFRNGGIGAGAHSGAGGLRRLENPFAALSADPSLFGAREPGPGRRRPLNWFRIEQSCAVAADGNFELDCRLWDSTGALVGSSRQMAGVVPWETVSASSAAAARSGAGSGKSGKKPQQPQPQQHSSGSGASPVSAKL